MPGIRHGCLKTIGLTWEGAIFVESEHRSGVVLVPPHTYPNGSSSPETVPEHSASLHRNYGYASDLSKHSGTISGKLSSRRFRRGEVLVRLRGACPELDSGVLIFHPDCTIPA